ncbi:cation diffusion facilitator family transporter [Flammeovirga kamogawensis]|uniref:Cation diffusion facilitator family transporter n=1 Tax=Flammeovirga kamogawensis TaxID=373891 RepID=A0ABX8GVU7_9BACT|nr:cation diffusion facilitator family transporter [Flammeovirga kamogawensis]MBB6461550.1 cobalt-zinc-cadmium efflux system protein [Flammeovirga kamogawensis]QWG07518.1 cation diffusion facilitator family transporter [Flammeovirga kamogawensis]TRX69331.1 cation transporter [Flammeovirga kamogawensis]
MAHQHHHHGHSHGQHNHSTDNIGWAFFLNLFFTIIEFIGGAFTNSVAIMADAVHDLGDTVAIGVGYFFEKYSNKKENNFYTYGYRRYSTLAAMINIVVLTTGSILMIVKTIPRLITPEAVDAQGMVYMGILGVIVNGAAVFKLMSNKNSANQRVMMLHMLEDTLGWIAVLIGAGVMVFWDLPIIDPILSLCIATFILYNAIKNLIAIMPIFLQAAPTGVDQEKIINELIKIPDVVDTHDLHIWSLDGEFNIMSLHLVVAQKVTIERAAEIKKKVREIIDKDDVKHITIEIEREDEDCHEDCNH